MKFLASLWLILGTACGVVASAEGDSLVGKQVSLVLKIEALSVSGNYGDIYELLGTDYRSVVTKETFVRVSKDTPWTLTKVQVGTLYEYPRTAYLPVRGIVSFGDKRERVDSVHFFVKEEKEWKLQNFPFLGHRLPNFAVIPEWLQ